MRNVLAVLVVAAAALVCLPQEAQAHNAGYPGAVNAGKWVVVKDETRYNAVLRDSMGWWNRFYFDYNKRGAAFVYKKDTSMAVTLRVVDVTGQCGANWAARYRYYSPGVDYVLINVCHFNRYSGFTRRVAVGHELGHALGFGHVPITDYYRKNSIMVATLNQPYQYPRYHDRVDYYNKYVR